jgi:hypothetical protein
VCALVRSDAVPLVSLLASVGVCAASVGRGAGLALGVLRGALPCRVVAMCSCPCCVSREALAGLCGRLLLPPLGAVLSLLRWLSCVLWGAFRAVSVCQLVVAYRCPSCFFMVSVASGICSHSAAASDGWLPVQAVS